FVTLAFAELFHMLGMSCEGESFLCVFKKKNFMMGVAFFVGVVLQIFVVVTPGVNLIFKTHSLDYKQWLIAVGLSILPLLLHEIFVIVNKLKK
ncbi:MAG: cation-translocating P-type ATPase C-terminal domain-containing protein, partial [Bacilli bacterium]|nr:cation-translocating P-type ATPase C-terminal domain-containing protein [Bacilli bacterium]